MKIGLPQFFLQIPNICLIIEILQELHSVLGQLDMLQFKFFLKLSGNNFFSDEAETWYLHVHFAYANNTQKKSPLIFILCIFFHIQLRIKLNVHSNFSQNNLCGCTAQYCSHLSPHSRQSTDISPLLYWILLKQFLLRCLFLKQHCCKFIQKFTKVE